MAGWVDGDAESMTLGGYKFPPNGNNLG